MEEVTVSWPHVNPLSGSSHGHMTAHVISHSLFDSLSLPHSLPQGIITSPTLEQYGLHKSSLVTSYSGTHPFLYLPVKRSSTQSIPSLPLTYKEQPDPCVPAAEWCEFYAHVLPGSALASCGQCGGCRSHFCYRSCPSSLSVPQPPSQDGRLPTASRAISMYDKCRVCRQANLVSALPRWGPGLRYHWKIIYRCEERRGKSVSSGWEKMTPIFPPFFFFFWPEGSLKLSSRWGANSGDSAELVCFHACFI